MKGPSQCGHRLCRPCQRPALPSAPFMPTPGSVAVSSSRIAVLNVAVHSQVARSSRGCESGNQWSAPRSMKKAAQRRRRITTQAGKHGER